MTSKLIPNTVQKIRMQGKVKVITLPKMNEKLKEGDYVAVFSVEEIFDKAMDGTLHPDDFKEEVVKA